MFNFVSQKSMGFVLAAGVVGCLMSTNAFALEDSKYIYGIKDTGGEYLFGDNGGWTVHTEYIGMDQTGGKDFTKADNISNIVTLNHGHYYNQVPTNFDPADGHFPDYRDGNIAAYAARVADYISDSQGVNYWVIGEELNTARTWAGATNGKMYGGTGDWMRTTLYTEFYNAIYDAVKAVAPDAKLCPAPTAPYAPPLSMGDFVPGYIDYWQDCLEGIGADKIDALPFKVYTHDSNPDRITSTNTFGPGVYDDNYYDFQAYKDFMAAIPEDMKDKPTMIVDTHQGSEHGMNGFAWNDTDNGWVQAMYAEVNKWNQENDQQILCAALHRWDSSNLDGTNTYGIESLTDLHDGITEAVGEGYQSRAIPEPASLMLLGLGGLALLRRRA